MQCVHACGINLRQINEFTCAIVATTKPNVNAIWTIDGEYPVVHAAVVLAIPIDTKKNVPKNSANNIFQILRLFVMSLTPMIRLTPEINGSIVDKMKYHQIFCSFQFLSNIFPSQY